MYSYSLRTMKKYSFDSSSSSAPASLQIQNTQVTNDDMQLNATPATQSAYKRNWCLAKSSQTFISQKIPVNKFKISLPCPGYLKGVCTPASDQINTEWRCQKCGFYLEYAKNSEYFYCLCGAGLINSFRFKCSNKNHGNDFLEYDDKKLKTYLDKCLEEVKNEK